MTWIDSLSDDELLVRLTQRDVPLATAAELVVDRDEPESSLKIAAVLED